MASWFVTLNVSSITCNRLHDTLTHAAHMVPFLRATHGVRFEAKVILHTEVYDLRTEVYKSPTPCLGTWINIFVVALDM